MMKKIYFFLVAIAATFSANAQNDTLLYQGFETKAGKSVFDDMLTEPTGKDTKWINWDKDKILAADGAPSDWYQAGAFYDQQISKPVVINQTAHIWSYLKDAALGSKNYLISPPISINDDKATLSWKSCPFRGPSYMDGYKVLITVTSNDITKAKPDTVFVAAEVTSYKAVDADNSLKIADYKYTKGRIHGDSYKLKQYSDTTKTMNTTSGSYYLGRLEPHTVSLAKYKGKKIYVHIAHDSEDDYILEIDDILVRGSKPVGTQDAFVSNIRLVTYPNPTVNYMNVLYRLEKPSDVTIDVMDIQGKMVQKLFNASQINGEMNHDFDVSGLSAGTYLLQVKVGKKVATQKFVKEN